MSPIQVLVLDFAASSQILRSVAAAQVIAQTTTYGWRTTDLIASANMWGEVGMWETQVPKGRELRAAIDFATRNRALMMVEIASQGPVPLLRWLGQQVALRDRYLDNYHSQVAAMAGINRTTLGALDASVKLIKTARFVASVGLITGAAVVGLMAMGVTTAVGVGGAATTFGAGAPILIPVIGLGKSIAFAVIKSWDQSTYAKGVSIAFETGKTGVNEGLGAFGHNVTHGGVLLAATTATADEDLQLALAARQKALQLAQKNVSEGEARLLRMEQLKIGGQSTRGIKQRAAQIAGQRSAVEAEKQILRQVTADSTLAAEKVAAQQMERQALIAARGQLLRVGGKCLSGAAITVFGVWDLYDSVVELGE